MLGGDVLAASDLLFIAGDFNFVSSIADRQRFAVALRLCTDHRGRDVFTQTCFFLVLPLCRKPLRAKLRVTTPMAGGASDHQSIGWKGKKEEKEEEKKKNKGKKQKDKTERKRKTKKENKEKK